MYLQPKFFQWHPVLSRPSMDAGDAGLPLSEIRPPGGGIKVYVWSVRQLSPTIINKTHNN